MKKPKPTTAKNFAERATKFAAHVLENPDDSIFEAFDGLLDELANDDYFGTEGQNDPRGDRR